MHTDSHSSLLESHWASAVTYSELYPFQLVLSHYTIRLRVCRIAPPFNIRSSNDLSRRTSYQRHNLFQYGRFLWSGDICHKILEVESDEREERHGLLDGPTDM